MLNFENPKQTGARNLLGILLVGLALILMVCPSAASAEGHPCQNAVQNLRSDLDVILNRDGLWALMERTEGLQEKSMVGMQADGKLARLVGQFETLCESEKKPTKQLFVTIENLLGEARTIFNPRSSGEEIFKLVENLVKELNALLAKIE